ncbi:MAG: hypothetical protein J7K49_04750 [Thaumarchaeota archaeon]|nr:hypothetical protein [Nitrososphaerota archaeon]
MSDNVVKHLNDALLGRLYLRTRFQIRLLMNAYQRSILTKFKIYWTLTGSGIRMRDVNHVLFVLGAIGYTLVMIKVFVDLLLGGYVIELMDEGTLMSGTGLLSLAWLIIGGKYGEKSFSMTGLLGFVFIGTLVVLKLAPFWMESLWVGGANRALMMFTTVFTMLIRPIMFFLFYAFMAVSLNRASRVLHVRCFKYSSIFLILYLLVHSSTLITSIISPLTLLELEEIMISAMKIFYITACILAAYSFISPLLKRKEA